MKTLQKLGIQKLAIAAAATLFFSGCATISEGPSQMVTIRASDDSNVNATIETKSQTDMFGNGFIQSSVVTLPTTVAISRKDGARIKISTKDNPDYENTEYVIAGRQNINPWYFGNIFLLPYMELGTTTTDPMSGAMWKYANPNFVVPVKKKPKRR